MIDTPPARRLSQPELFRPPLTYPSMPFGERLTRAVHLYPENEASVFKDPSLTFREVEGLTSA